MEFNKISGAKIKLRRMTDTNICGFSFNLPSLFLMNFLEEDVGLRSMS